MNERFEKIPAAEQQQILQAAFEEFADKGYRQASTNLIVKTAGIPKGTLFYFFGSKKNLFLYLIDIAIDNYVSFVNDDKSVIPNELFERLMHREQVKLRFAAAYPLQFRFFSKVFLDIPDAIKEEMTDRFKAYSAASAEDLSAGIDHSRFRDGIDEAQAIQMIHLLLEGIFARYAPLMKAAKGGEFDALIKKISAECRRYFEMIKSGIYR